MKNVQYIIISLCIVYCCGCSISVARHNKRLSHPFKEINFDAKIIEGYKVDESFRSDSKYSYELFRFTGLLKGENRVVDIFIPPLKNVGDQPVIKEVDATFEPINKDKIYLNVDTKNQGAGIIEKNSGIEPMIILGINDGYNKESESLEPDSPIICLEYINKSCDPVDNIVCKRTWFVKPKFHWVQRRKIDLWISRSRYLITIPLDVAAIGALSLLEAMANDYNHTYYNDLAD